VKWLGLLSDSWAVLLGPVQGDQAAFKDYLIQNVMMGMFIFICAAKLILNEGRCSRGFWGLGLAVGFIALFIAVERGRTGQIGFLLGVALICLFYVRPSQWFFPASALCLVMAVTYALHDPWRNHFNLALAEAINYQSNPLSSVGNRVYLYDWSIRFMSDQSFWTHLIGFGTASYPTLAKASFTANICVTSCPHPHSQFLFFWIEYGLIGVVAFCVLFIHLLRLARRSSRFDAQIMLAGFIGIFFADSVFHSSLWLRIEGFFSIMMIALLSTLAHNPHQRKDSQQLS
jgi:O-antigen ligase